MIFLLYSTILLFFYFAFGLNGMLLVAGLMTIILLAGQTR